MTELQLDLHVHSLSSVDAVNTVGAIIGAAERANLDGLSITDHNTLNHTLIEKLRTRTDLITIPGEEIDTSIGHVLAYFIEDEIKPNDDPFTVIDRIHEQDGLAILAHPFRFKHTYRNDLLKRLDGIEELNGRSGDPAEKTSPNGRTRRMNDREQLACTAGSDGHFFWEVGSVRTVLPEKSEVRTLKEALRDGAGEPLGTPGWNGNHTLSRYVERLRGGIF